MNYPASTHLLFTPLQPEMADVIFKANTASIKKYFHSFNSLVEAENWISKSLEEIALGEKVEFALYTKETHDFVGLVSLRDLLSPTPEFGFWITESQQKHGYGKESIQELIKWAWENTTATELLYITEFDNIPSIALAKSLSLKRKADLIEDGIVFQVYAAEKTE